MSSAPLRVLTPLSTFNYASRSPTFQLVRLSVSAAPTGLQTEIRVQSINEEGNTAVG